MRCKYCGSKMLFPDKRHEHFSTKKAIVGAVTVGLVGAAAGFIGKDIKGYRCGTCGAFSEEPMDFADEFLIDSAVREMKNSGRSKIYEECCEKYAGIEKVSIQTESYKENRKTYALENVKETGENNKNHDLIAPKVKNAYIWRKFVKGCPILIETISVETDQGSDILRLLVRNISGKELRSVYIKAVVFDDVNDLINTNNCIYQGMQIAAGEYFPKEVTFDLKTDVAYKVEVVCEKAAFSDDTVWRADSETLEYALTDELEMTIQNFPQYKYFASLLSEKSSYYGKTRLCCPVFEKEYRICACGTPVSAEENCPVCGLDEQQIQDVVNYETLVNYRGKLIAQTAKMHTEKLQKLYAEAQEKQYTTAVELFEKNTHSSCLEAAKLFGSIRNYKDAAEKEEQSQKTAEDARKNKIYEKASAILSRSVVLREDYEKAIAEFKKISGWKDADIQIVNCQKRIKELQEEETAEQLRQVEEERRRKKRNIITGVVVSVAIVVLIVLGIYADNQVKTEKYNAAITLMNESSWKAAVDAFSEIETFNDSADKIKECKYAYIKAHYNNTDETTYAYLRNLMYEDYKDCESLYDKLYAVSIKLVANTSATNRTQDTSTFDSSDMIYFHYVVNGGYPGQTFDVKVSWEDSEGTDDYSYIELKRGEYCWTALTPGYRIKWAEFTVSCNGVVAKKYVRID